jgi:hypothetical protein
VGYPSSPNRPRQRKYPGGICLILTSLRLYFITSRNGDALPAAMGTAAKRACRLQERRSCR